MDSQSVFGSDDEMDGATHMYQEDFKRFIIHVMELSGGKWRRQLWSKVQKWLERASEKDWLDFYVTGREVEWVPCAGWSLHDFNIPRTSQVALVVKNLPANAGDIRDVGSTPGLERSPGEQNGNPLQDSCLEYPMDRGAWRSTVVRAAESDTTESDWAHSTGSKGGST